MFRMYVLLISSSQQSFSDAEKMISCQFIKKLLRLSLGDFLCFL